MFQQYVFDELESTNDYLKANYQQYQDKSVIVAKTQTKGRGRFDRVWESAQDLTFSILFKTAKPHRIIAPLVIVKALESLGYQAMIKWPNDVLIDGKKVCGILIEQCYLGSNCQAIIVGIGINLSPKQERKACFVNERIQDVLDAILNEYDTIMHLDQISLVQMYRQYQYVVGKKLQLDDGIWDVVDISEEGYLQIETQGKKKVLTSEEVTLSQLYE